MKNFGLPVRYGLFGLAAGLAGFALSVGLGLNPDAPWWALTLAGGAGGAVAGLIRQRRGG